MRNNLGNTVPRTGLVAEYLLDGNANASVGTNGTATNVTWVKTNKGYQNQAGSFNGSSSYAEISNVTLSQLFNGRTGFSINFIIKANSISATTVIIDGRDTDYNGCWIELTNTGILKFQRSNGTTGEEAASSNFGLSTGVYYNINLQYNGTNVFFTINNIKQNIGTSTINLNSGTVISIGRGRASSDRFGYFNGTIQGVRIYNVALTQDEIQTLYYEGLRKLGPTQVASYPSLLSGLAGYWDFKGSAHNLVDGVNATVTGATLTTDRFGNTDSGYSFNGTTNGIDTINNTTTNNLQSFSIGAWVKINAFNTNQMIFSKNWKWFNIRNNGVIEADVAQSTTPAHSTTTNTVSTGTYNHILYTFSAGVIEIYLNGTLCSYSNKTTGVGSIIADATKNWLIGRYDGAGYYLNGNVDEVMIFNRALSSDEVNTLYKLTSQDYIYPAPSYDLLSLREGLILDLDWNGNDKSGNGNNGTLVNSPTKIRQGKAKGLSYNGSNQYISLTGGYVGTGNRTVSLWADIKTLNSYTVLFSEGGNSINNQWGIKTHLTTGYIGTYIFQGNENTSTINIGLHNIVMNYNGTHIRLYIDGVFISQVTASLNINNTIREIGRIALVNSLYFNGSILNPKIRNRALSDKEIQQEYYASKGNFIY